MTQDLAELLRRGAESVPVPSLDLDGLVAEAGRRRRRRRVTVVAGGTVAAAAVVAAVVGSTGSERSATPPPAGTPTSSPTASAEARGSRPLVYASGRTVHVGDRSVTAEKPVAFIAPTDDGAVYEATLDGTLWFTDGTTTEIVGVIDGELEDDTVLVTAEAQQSNNHGTVNPFAPVLRGGKKSGG